MTPTTTATTTRMTNRATRCGRCSPARAAWRHDTVRPQLRIERDARRLAREQRADEEDAAANLEEQVRDQTEVIALPSPEELQQEDEAPPDLDALKL